MSPESQVMLALLVHGLHFEESSLEAFHASHTMQEVERENILICSGVLNILSDVTKYENPDVSSH